MPGGHSYGMGTMGVDWEERVDNGRMRDERLSKVEAALEKQRVDALFLFRLENIRYVSTVRNHDRPYTGFGLAVAVLPRGGRPIVYNFDYLHAAARAPWLRDWQVDASCRGLGSPSGATEWAQDAARRLGELNHNPKTIGVDAWTSGLFEALPHVFPQVEFVDGQAILEEAKKIKSLDEIRCIGNACAITEAGMEAGRRFLRPGRLECQIQTECFMAMYRLGSEWMDSSGIVCSGPYTAPLRRFTSDRIVDYGDPVIIEIGGRYNGYFAHIARTWACGQGVTPSKELVALYKKAFRALRSVEDATTPGASTVDLGKAAGGCAFAGLLGHGIGVSAIEAPHLGTYPGGALAEGGAVTLEPGMVFTLETYAGEPGVGGVRLADTLLVTEQGHEVLTDYPFDERLLD